MNINYLFLLFIYSVHLRESLHLLVSVQKVSLGLQEFQDLRYIFYIIDL